MIDVRQFSLTSLYEKYFSAVSGARREKTKKYRMEKDRYRSLGAGVLLEWGFYQQLTGKSCQGVKDFLCPEVTASVHGKPYFKEYPNIYFNLSHAANYAVAAFGSAELGVDIEAPGRFCEKIVRHFFTPREQKWIAQFKGSKESEKDIQKNAQEDMQENMKKKEFVTEKEILRGRETIKEKDTVKEKETAKEREAFARIWTRKESFIKMDGAGLTYGLENVETCGNDSLLSCMTWQHGSCQQIWYFHEYIYKGHIITVCTPESLCGSPEEIVLP